MDSMEWSGIAIRSAREDELPRILELYGILQPLDPVPDPALALEAWRGIMADPRQRVLVLEADGHIVSTCVLVIVPNLTRGCRPYALIENVVTDPAHRGKGYGTMLLKGAQGLARDAGCYKAMLMTSSKKPETLRFYEGAGFDGGDKTGFIVRFP